MNPPAAKPDSNQADAFCAAAHAHHMAGRMAEAEKGYRATLAINPRHVDALHFLGILALQFGHAPAGAQLIGQSVEISPNFASLNNLGEAMRQLGRLDDAVRLFERSLQMKPDHVDAMANLAMVLTQQNRLDLAEQQFARALTIQANHVGALAGAALLLEKRAETGSSQQQAAMNTKVATAWERVVRLAPKHFQYQRSLGNALLRSDDVYGAASAFRRASELNPSDAECHAKIGFCLSAINKFDEALAEIQKAIDLAPDRWEAYRERGRVLERAERASEAADTYRRAIELQPNNAMLYADLGRMLMEMGDEPAALVQFTLGRTLDANNYRFPLSQSKIYFQMERYEDALAAAHTAVRLAPNDPDAHSALAFSLLAMGRYDEGFAEYEWRWRAATFTTKPRDFDQPLWDGSDITGRDLLLHSEQGYGDTFQFLRYVPLLMARDIRVTIEVPYKLAGLVRRMSPGLRVVTQGTIVPPFDLHVPMLSLPAIFRTTAEHLPATVPYLRADPTLRERWKERLDRDLGETANLRVGIVWGGNAKPDKRRSATLAAFAPLAAIAGISWISMQPDEQAEQIKDAPAGMKLLNLGPELRDFSDTTASLLANLDLLITVDTGVAHLAGAMGVPTWILLRHSPDWRWVGPPRTSPWYPTVRLFRQLTLGDWASVLNEVAGALRDVQEKRATNGTNGHE